MSKRVPKFHVKADGSEISQQEQTDLLQINIELRRQAPASVEILFDNQVMEQSELSSDPPYDSRNHLSPGKVIEVSLGYEGEQLTKVFEGEVIGTRVKMLDNGPKTFTLRAFDFLHRLTRGRKTRTFLEMKFSDIVQAVAGDWSLSADVEDTQFLREYVIQHNQTDLDFIRGIAAWLDFDLRIPHLEDASKLCFAPPDVGGDPVIKAVYENPNLSASSPPEVYLRKFDGRLSLARVVSEVIVRGWDPKRKEEILGTASLSLYDKMGGEVSATEEVQEKWGETERQLVDYKVFSQEEAAKIAESKLNEYARTFIRADVEIQGSTLLAPGSTVEISRAGPRFDGKYFIESVSHIFKAPVGAMGGYTTRFVGARCAW